MKLEEVMPEQYASLWKDAVDPMRLSFREVALEATRSAFEKAAEICHQRGMEIKYSEEDVEAEAYVRMERLSEVDAMKHKFREMAKELE